MANHRKHDKQEAQEADAEAPIHGDILEVMFSHVPLIDLLPSCRVSKSWNRAVFSSLRHLNKIKPWLLVHMQRTRSPHLTTTHAYDPRSHVWIHLDQPQPSVNYVSALRSSHSPLLYMLSPSKFSFSFDPLHLTWHDVDAPQLWRTDPIVAVVGRNVVIAGGASEFEDDDPLAVDMYNLETRAWERCQTMPTILKDSAASSWLSVAVVNSRKLYVTEKYSGLTYSFDPESKSWYGPYDLRPDQNICFSAITFAKDRLILVGLTGGVNEDVKSVKLWEVKGEWLDEFKEMGELPISMMEKLKGSCISSIEVTSMGDYVYIHNPGNPEELAMCEINVGGDHECEYECEWSSIKNRAVNEESRIIASRMILSCSSVGMAELHRALMHENRRFVVTKH
ncbi:F-box/kelch-repeat protein [Melia azedarach]|uniref:F-box/kelch-repeat protein n=1 Tax=Melia azedarach TaxID=155640 RepID=A0ACC1XI10_MELAZ|nr:F-box/kelch-repeat protein [Melia azedarach]